MKAAIREQYGPPEELQVQEVSKPTPGENEILVKVINTTVNRTDCGILTGQPSIIRLFTGLRKPKFSITGTDFAGIVEQVGEKVEEFKPGNKIFGFHDNGIRSHAEFLILDVRKPVLKIPESIDFREAAASLEGHIMNTIL